MADPVVRSPPVWDGRGGIRPEQVARRQRLAKGAAIVALAIAVPAVVGSSAGWWSSAGSVEGVPPLDGATGGASSGVETFVGDPLTGAADGDGGREAGMVGLGGGLFDAGLELGTECPGRPVDEGADPIVVGVVADRGIGASAGGQGAVEPIEVAVARLVVDVVNCAGGLGGRTVVLEVAEAEGSPVATGDAVARLLGRGALVLIGPSRLEIALRTAEAAGGRVPVLSPLSIEPALNDQDRGLFLLGPDAATLADAAARHARGRGWRSAAVFVGADPVEDLAATTFTDGFMLGGGSVTARLPLVLGVDGAVDVTDQVARLGAGPVSQPPPQVIFAAVPPELVGELHDELAAAGIDVPILAIDRRQPLITGEVVADGIELVGRAPIGPDGRVLRLADAIGDETGVALDDPLAAARVADAVLVALAAIEGAAAAESATIVEQLRAASPIDGIGGPAAVWPGARGGDAAMAIPVLGPGPDGPVLAATVDPSAS